MTDETAKPTLGDRIRSGWAKAQTWWKGGNIDSEKELKTVREKTPTPVLWLYGKTQSGKTSLIRFLTGAEDAEIGSGFRACTKHSRMFPFPTEEAPVLTFLDTRGVDEPGYDPAEEIAAFDYLAHIILVTCRIRDFATGNLRTTLKKIRAANPKRPVVLLLTCLHEAYPQEQHPQPYPYSVETLTGVTPPAGGPKSESILALIAEQRKYFDGLIDRIVPVDLTKPEEGFEDTNYGGDALKQAVLDLLPSAYRETLKHLTEATGQFSQLYLKRAQPVLVGYSTLAATAGALPIPFVDLLAIPAIQARMVKELADRSGSKDSGNRFLELSASAGIGLLATVALRQVAKLIPFVGSAVGAGLAGASTYALGRAFLEYDRRVHEGHIPDQSEVAKLYKEQFAAAERTWAKKEG